MIQDTFTEHVCRKSVVNMIDPDHVLVDAARAGNELAFVELWNHHSGKIFRTVLRIVKNHEDAEDVLQEVCLKVFINLQKFDGRSQILTWITSIAINTALTRLRRKRVRQETPMVVLSEEDGWCTIDVRDESIDIEEQYARNEREAWLRQAMGDLSPKLRTVVEMYLSQDMSITEIARLIGVSTNATKSRLFRARAILHTSLNRKLNCPRKSIFHQYRRSNIQTGAQHSLRPRAVAM